jgi:C-terminal processing protease CtpA/Prc
MNYDHNLLSHTARSEVVETLIDKLYTHYVFPTVVEEIALFLRKRQNEGAYEAISGGEELARTLSAHLQEISKDKQLAVFYKHSETESSADEEASNHYKGSGDSGAIFNYGFEKVERLAGNIGYLSIHAFFSPSVAARAAITATDFIAHTNTLIIDLRKSVGGNLSMVNFFASYFFPPEPAHLNNIYWRASNSTQQFWTLPYVPGQRYVDKLVYILTSRTTPAASEEFTYDLQSQKHATVIGEATAGEANPHKTFQLTAQLDCCIPVGRVINPITGTNWEGTGVIPDIAVSQEDAFKTAYMLALRSVRAGFNGTSTPVQKKLAEEVHHILAALE